MISESGVEDNHSRTTITRKKKKIGCHEGEFAVDGANNTQQQRNNEEPLDNLSRNNEVMDDQYFGPSEKQNKTVMLSQKPGKKQRKKARKSGESFISVVGKIIPKKTCVDFDCHCRLKCVENISFPERCKNFEKFYSNSSWETQTAILSSTVKVVPIKRKRKQQESRRSENREYYLKSGSTDVFVCKAMFMKTLAVDSTRIHRALYKSKFDNSLVDKRGRRKPANATSGEKLLKVVQRIQSFPALKSHYRRSDTPDCRYLPSHLNT